MIYVGIGGEICIYPDGSWNDDKWHHMTVVHKEGETLIYVDGHDYK